MKTPREIAEDIADAGALLAETDEARAIKRAVRNVISVERRGVVRLTKAEAQAALDALGQMTCGNAYDFGEWRKNTSGTRAEWDALLRAEKKLRGLSQ
jgi:hypothetical protein